MDKTRIAHMEDAKGLRTFSGIRNGERQLCGPRRSYVHSIKNHVKGTERMGFSCICLARVGFGN
jgi:hypothetical protein